MGDIYHAGEVYAGSVPIDDTKTSEKTVYSSAKVETMMEEVQDDIDAQYISPTGTLVEELTNGTEKSITLDKGCYVIRAYANEANGTARAKFGDISMATVGGYVAACVGPIYFKGGTVTVKADFGTASGSYGRVLQYQ